jgi:hypothetical protein
MEKLTQGEDLPERVDRNNCKTAHCNVCSLPIQLPTAGYNVNQRSTTLHLEGKASSMTPPVSSHWCLGLIGVLCRLGDRLSELCQPSQNPRALQNVVRSIRKHQLAAMGRSKGVNTVAAEGKTSPMTDFIQALKLRFRNEKLCSAAWEDT